MIHPSIYRFEYKEPPVEIHLFADVNALNGALIVLFETCVERIVSYLIQLWFAISSFDGKLTISVP